MEEQSLSFYIALQHKTKSRLYKYLIHLINKLHKQKPNSRPGQNRFCYENKQTNKKLFVVQSPFSEGEKMSFISLFSINFVTELSRLHKKDEIDSNFFV